MKQRGQIRSALIAVCLGVALIGAGPAMAAEDADAEAVEDEQTEAEEAAAAAITEARANISISNAWTRATPGNATNAAVYLRIGNIGEDARAADRRAGRDVRAGYDSFRWRANGRH